MSRDREVVVFNHNEGVADFAVQKWMDISSRSIAKNGYFSAALSGGRTPVDFYEKLSTCKTLPWDKTHLFLADERFVPASDEDSNYGLIKEHLVSHINIPTQNIHPVLTQGITVERSAGNYEEDIRRFFHSGREGFPAFDLIMLGIGGMGIRRHCFPAIDH
jgi:6-phosphogluconolactonase